MNKLLSLSSLIFFLCLTSLSAQRQLPALYEDAQAITLRYNLNDAQREALEDILEQREQNFAALENLSKGDELAYWQKRKNIYVGEQASIKMILNTPEQRAAFDQLRYEVRLAESELIKELIAVGHSKQEARLLLLQRKY